MGACCTRLESIEHVKTISDLKTVIKKDIDFYFGQHKAMKDDTVIII
jgi:hypothetical protein